jgi:site-specific DNA recombinase
MKTEYAVGAVRVSSTKQGLQGDSPDDQKHQIERRAQQLSERLGIEIRIVKWFKFVESASGELDTQPIQQTISYCSENSKISYFIFKSIDRMTRGGGVMYGLLKMQLAKYNVRLVDTYGVINDQETNTLAHLGIEYKWSKYDTSWITELLEAERAKGDVRDILTRLIGAEIRYQQLGYWVSNPPYGYKNIRIETHHGKRTVLASHEVESKFILKMYELKLLGTQSDEQIVKEINELGYKSRRVNKRDKQVRTRIIGFSGEKPLTVKQLNRYIRRPIYAGIIKRKWTKNIPIRGLFDGLISVDTFNKANRGKYVIVEEGDTIKMFKNKPPDWQLRKTKDNPLYPYKQYVLCPKCRKQLLGSASRGKSGKRFPAYHCHRGHYFRVPIEKFNKTIREFIIDVRFKDHFKRRFSGIVLEEWEKRRKAISSDSNTLEQRVIDIRGKKDLIIDRIKRVESSIAIRAFEKELEQVELELTRAIYKRDHKENEEVDIQTLINYAKYYMEHFGELLLESDNPAQRGGMFGLIFDDLPTYEDLLCGTPRLAPLFMLNQQSEVAESQVVIRQGLEP